MIFKSNPFVLPVATALLIFACSGIFLIYSSQQIQEQSQIETATAAARTYARSLAAFRAFYVAEVAPDELELDLLSSPSPHSKIAELTAPYTNLLNLGENTARSLDTGRYRVYSEHPWPMRELGGAQNLGELTLLKQILQNQLDEFIHIDQRDSGQVLMLGMPIIMQSTCVSCHNNHPQSPITTWQVGDIRGVQSVEIKLPPLSSVGLFNLSEFNHLTLIFAFLLAGTALLVFIMLRGAKQWFSQRQADEILEGIAESILVLNQDNKIIASNKVAYDTFGYNEVQLQNMHIDTLLPDYSTQSEQTTADRATSCYGHTSSNNNFPCLVSMRDSKVNTTEGKILTIRDMTEHEQLTSQLQLEQQMNAIGRLTAGIAHGFNNILTTVIGNKDLITTQLSQQQTRFATELDAIDTAVEQGAEITDALVKFAQQDHFDFNKVNVTQTIMAIEPLILAAVPKHITLDISLPHQNLHIWVNSQRFNNSVLALVLNAVEAMPTGGQLRIKVALADAPATSNTTEKDKFVEISVADDGQGITQEHIDEIWEPYFTTSDISQGRGLGLSTVYGFVKQCQGHIDVISKENQGTTIFIRLPLYMQT